MVRFRWRTSPSPWSCCRISCTTSSIPMNATMLAVFFDSATSEDVTMDAIREIRSIAGKQCFVSGMSALVTDLKDLCEQEEPIYVALAVACACAAMMLLLDGWLVPFVFLASIGMCILYQPGQQLLPRRDLLHHQGAVRRAAAGRDHGLLHLPVAQLQRAAGAHRATTRRPWRRPSTRPSPRCMGSSITTSRGLYRAVLHELHAGPRPGHRDGKGRAAGRDRLRDRPARH